MYFVYLLVSLQTGMFYIGSTQHLLQRFEEHNTNRSQFTKNKGPWAFEYFLQNFNTA